MAISRWSCWCLVAVALVGCGSRQDYSGAKRFPLSGRVTYEGQPIDLGSISFLPVDGSEQRVSGGYIENGVYSVPEAQGANAGKYRIEIRWQKPTGKKVRDANSNEMVDQRAEGLGAEFNTKSILTADVSAKQTKFDFELTSQGVGN